MGPEVIWTSSRSCPKRKAHTHYFLLFPCAGWDSDVKAGGRAAVLVYEVKNVDAIEK